MQFEVSNFFWRIIIVCYLLVFIFEIVLFLSYRQPYKLLKYMCSTEIIYET